MSGDPPRGAESADSRRLEEALATPIALHGAQRAFGTFTREEVRERADELKAAVGFGPTVRVAPVAQAWRELEITLGRAGAETVGALDAETVLALAPKLWVLPPGGSLL